MKKQIKKTQPKSNLKKFQLDKKVVSSFNTKRVKGGALPKVTKDIVCQATVSKYILCCF